MNPFEDHPYFAEEFFQGGVKAGYVRFDFEKFQPIQLRANQQEGKLAQAENEEENQAKDVIEIACLVIPHAEAKKLYPDLLGTKIYGVEYTSWNFNKSKFYQLEEKKDTQE